MIRPHFILLLSIFLIVSACTEDEPACIEVEAEAMFIQSVEKYVIDRLTEDVIDVGGVDTFSFPITLKNGKFSSGFSKGTYKITGTSITFTQKEDLCPDTADCLFPLILSPYRLSCDAEKIVLEGDVSGTKASNSGSRYTIDYEVLERRIIILK